MSENQRPSYIANARPNPQASRAPWFKNTAPAYAGILLWFVFWTMINSNSLVNGIWVPIAAVIVGALVCHIFFYLFCSHSFIWRFPAEKLINCKNELFLSVYGANIVNSALFTSLFVSQLRHLDIFHIFVDCILQPP